MVRFGRDTLELEHLVNQAALCYEALGFYGISFYGDNNLSVDEIARLAGKPNQEIRISTVGRFRGTGFELARRGRFPHLTLRFPSPPSDRDLKPLEAMFGEPVANPHPLR